VIVVDGRKTRKATGLDVGAEAEAELVLSRALEQLRADDAIPDAGELTLKAWGERWIEDRKARGKLEWVHEQLHLRYFLNPKLGTKRLAAISDVDMLD
jgi:hypothetical protein